MNGVVEILGALIQFVIGVTVMLMGFAVILIVYISQLIHLLIALLK